MPFVPKKTREKVKAGYKTIYLPQSTIDALEQMAQENSTSFNNIVASMIDYVNEVRTMPDYKEMYLTLFRGIEQAKNIQIEAQRHCEEMYINAPESKLQLLPTQEDGELQSRVLDMADWKEMYHHLYLESHRAVIVMMDAQIQCDATDMNSMATEIRLLHSKNTSNLILDEGE